MENNDKYLTQDDLEEFFESFSETETECYEADFIVRSTRGTLGQVIRIMNKLSNGQRVSSDEYEGTLAALNHLYNEINDYLFGD